jgi:hypothetical protein
MADTWRHSVFTRYIALTEDAYHAYQTAGDSHGAGECARILAYLYSPSSPRKYRRWFDLADAGTDPKDYRGQANLARAAAIALGAQLAYSAAESYAVRASEYGERAGLVDAIADGYANLVECAAAQGATDRAVAAAERLIELALTVSNPRMRLAASAVAAPAFLRAGAAERAREEIDQARRALADFGTSEQAEVSLAEAVIGRDLGRWDVALLAYVETQRADLEGGFLLFSLVSRIQQARIRTVTEPTNGGTEAAAVATEAGELEAPLIASLASAVSEQARIVAGHLAVEGTAPHPEAGLEELAIRADTAALRGEASGVDPRPLWAAARGCWQRLGYTIWLARAQARSGDMDDAVDTLDVIGASDEARSWALLAPSG